MNKPFELISIGKKTIEIRLNDEKRQKLTIGDEIEFTKLSNPDEKLHVKIIDLLRYSSFKELIDEYGMEFYGYPADEDVEDFIQSIYTIYTPEDEKKYEVLGIRIELITK
ncbi:MAG: ASCH domain-containing protein [Patescibacteria group bacterium]|nr:ASCH domain-containing protein [Patescibacteria group bacterium]